MKHSQRNTRKYLTFGLFLVRSSYGVFSKILQGKRWFDAWHAVLTASTQKLWGDSYSSNMDLAIYISVRFFLSATTFDCRVYGVEYWCSIPSSLRNSSTVLFLNSEPLPLLIAKISLLNLRWSFLEKSMKVIFVSSLDLRKNTHEYLE